jgi:alkyldihydroxyacetonephosphate synthase
MNDRELSFWGWGYADKFPDDAERRDLKERVETLLDFPERPLLDPPTIEDAVETVPDTHIEIPDRLDEYCTADPRARVGHTYGKAYRDLVRGFHGDFTPAPDVVARPTTEDDIEAVLGWAAGENIAVVPYGGGTSVVAGVEGDVGSNYRGVVSLDLRSLDRVLDVDPVSRTARIRAGALGPDINDQLAEDGLQLRHYPQSYEFSTLGGWIATRAGGHFTTRYTHIDDFVENVRMVTPTETFETRRLPASGAGPDPNRLVLGSEGTLGVVTEAWMRVQPRPEYRSRATVHFDEFDAGVEATREVVQARLTPANCRLLDRNEAMLNEIAFEPVLLLGFESFDHPTEDDLERALAICAEHGGTLPDEPTHSRPDDERETDTSSESSGDGDRGESEEGEWRRSFFEAPYRYNTLVSIGVMVDTFETAVTWDGFESLHAAITEEVTDAMDRVCGGGFLSCRFTHVYPDGPAPYYTLLAPVEPGRELEQWREIKRTASNVLIDHGATITHHHAVGRTHREWYAEESPDGYRDSLREMKGVYDPESIMNPGVLLEPDM